MKRAAFSRACALTLALTACNGVFGLEEGHLAGHAGGTGGGQSTTAGSPTTGASGVTTGTGSTTASGPSTSGASGTGGGCPASNGITNGNFELQDTDGPLDWPKITNNVNMNLSTVSGLTTGLSMSFATIGAGGYGGVYQTKSFLDWNGCVRLSGDSRRKSGPSGQLRAKVTIGDFAIAADLPMGSTFQTFESTCMLPAPIDGFTIQLLGEDLPTGGSVTMEMNYVALDLVCCSGTEQMCPLHN